MIDYIADVLISRAEKQVDKSIIVYGLKQGISALSGVGVALLVGSIMGIFLQSCIFMVFFIPLRMYVGGYHAKTRRGCAAISIVLLLLSFLCIKEWIISERITLILGIIEILILYFLIPTHGAYQLDRLEQLVFRKKGRTILIKEAVVFISMSILQCSLVTESVVVVYMIVLFLVLPGKCMILLKE